MAIKRNKTSIIWKVLLGATLTCTICASLLLDWSTDISANANALMEEELAQEQTAQPKEQATDGEVVYYRVTMGDLVFSVLEGTKLAQPEDPVKESTEAFVYTFDGWYDGEERWDFVNDRVEKDLVLTAKFIESNRKYTVSFVVTGRDDVSFDPVEVEYGQTYDLSNVLDGVDVEKYNYVVGVDGKEASSVTVLSDVTVVVTFKEKTYYTVTINGVDVQMEIGSKLEKPADPSKESTAEFDYIFEGWYNGDEEWNFEEDTVDGALNLIAKYKEVKRKYTISFNIGGDSDISIGAIQMEYGDVFDVSKFIEGLNIVGYTYSVSVGGSETMQFKVVENVKVDINLTKKIANTVVENKDKIIGFVEDVAACFSGVDGGVTGMLLGASALAFAIRKRKKD